MLYIVLACLARKCIHANIMIFGHLSTSSPREKVENISLFPFLKGRLITFGLNMLREVLSQNHAILENESTWHISDSVYILCRGVYLGDKIVGGILLQNPLTRGRY